MRTIRQQLMIGLLGATLACVVGAGAMLYRSLLTETKELADLQLRQLAGAQPGEVKGSHDPEEAFVLQTWDASGERRYEAAAPDLPHLPRYDAQGYRDAQVNGAVWRIYGTSAAGRYTQVSQPHDARHVLAAHMALRAGAPLLLIAVLFSGLVMLIVRRALRPLLRLEQAVAGQSPTALRPLDPEATAPDLRPVVEALNGLMDKFEEAMAAQRTFIADAAHELRSPLTALKLQLQLVERADGAEARALALARLHERLDRGSHLVHQLLSLARQESGTGPAQWKPIDLNELLGSVVADHSALADSRGIDLGVESAQAIVLHADGDGMRVMLNNLVDNALRYIQAGGRVDLLAGREDGRIYVQVRDNGPGVAPEHRERLFDRFFRPDGNEAWGSGLGLSIVRSIADRHHAVVRLGEGEQGRGFIVTVLF
ncbi:ATP-binding protein [Duganella callida]|uniref:histidine kinase n=1 Tax=Duganella callida TaxID=2561932 RepID=A0A4Y9SFN8_9BURK|nr:ATP-binding protein [Duganella callida]TFW20095.1 two-component sensor histidine kinase [Duganella callida]